MTQEEFEPSRASGTDGDLIADLDRFTFDVRQRMVFFIMHFTGNKYCPICEQIIKVYKEDDGVDFDIHMNNDHNDDMIIMQYLEMYKEIKDAIDRPRIPV